MILPKENTFIVYKVTSPSGKVYVGITKEGFERRKQSHYSKAFRKERTGKFQNAILKYGENLIWEIIDNSATSWKELCELEKYYIQLFDSYHNGYNCTEGGEGNIGWNPSEEVKNKIAESNKGQKRSNKARYKMSQAKLGKKYGKRNKVYITSKPFKLINKDTQEILSIWNNISECARYLNTYSACINRCLKYPNKYRSYKQYKFEYCEGDVSF